MKGKLETFYKMVEGMETAMFTTRRPDGHLVSRAMATQVRSPGADLWFVTRKDAEKLDEIAFDPHINLGYYKDRTREWVSVSGLARPTGDRKKIHELYRPDWRAWFGDEGGKNDGTPDDARIMLIGVEIDSVVYFEVNKPQPVVLFQLLRGVITGKAPQIGEMREIRSSQIRSGRPAQKKKSAKAPARSSKSGAKSAARSKASGSVNRGSKGRAKKAAARPTVKKR